MKRSRASGRSCGMGYLKFEFPEVAAIAGKSMDNYTMFGVTLRCFVKSKEWESARPNLFRAYHSKKNVEKLQKTGFIEERDERLMKRKERAKEPAFASYESYLHKCHKMVENDQKLAARIKEAGIEYTYPPLKMDPQMEREWMECQTQDCPLSFTECDLVPHVEKKLRQK